jgi:hypothetical protein
MLRGNMMHWSKLNAAWLGLALIACAAFAGSVPEGDFRNWSEKQIKKILTDSPWIHRGYLRLPETDSSEGAPATPTDTIDFAEAISAGCGGCSYTPPNMHTLHPLDGYTVSWLSALPVKQALLRRQFGEKVPKGPSVDAYLAEDSSWYYISVGGLPHRIVSNNMQVLQRAAFLKTGDGTIIRAGEVEAAANRDSVTVFFSFPRKGADGKPAIRLEQKKVELLLEFGVQRIREEFKLKNMVYRGKLAL